MPFKNGKPDISPKQTELLKLCRAKTGAMKFILLSGTRMSGKSIGCMHAMADHLWNTKSGSVLVLCYTAGTASTSGIWNELTEKVLPDWIAADFGMEWVDRPRIHGATKKMMCSVLNKYGYEARQMGEEIPAHGISKLELDSLDDEREVEMKYKSRYYSMIYVSEAGEFMRSEVSLTTLMLDLRIVGLADEEHILLMDTNPAKEGTDHVIYKYWYELRISSEADNEEAKIQKCLHLTEWTMDDNPYLSEEKKAIIKSIYKNNPSLWSRYVDGLWVKVVEKGLFTKQFSMAIHTVGDIRDKDPELLVPTEECTRLITSHDAGGVNPVSYIIEECVIHVDEKHDLSLFQYIDELAFIGEVISVEEFTLLFLEKMDFWEKVMERELTWEHFADRSALDFTESIANRTVADEMFSVSGGRIKLIGVDKGRGSVGNRIRLWRKLLTQQRVLISAAKCPKLVEMNENINCGRIADTVAAHSPYKHPFDAATYAPSKKCWEELQDSIHTIRAVRKSGGSGLVGVRM
jgi:hypothetical protein